MGSSVPGLARGAGLAPRGPFLWKTGTTLSVGNLAFGGRGKTPIVALLARHVLARGERPAILSRGYGRRRPEDGAVVVSDGRHLLADLDRAGDEPLMLARALPGVIVVVCDVRTIAAAIATHVLGATVLILDDGFQHRAMARDVDLVVVAPEDLNGRPAPFGRLRESPSALARAHAVIVDGQPPARLPQAPQAALFTMRRTIGSPVSLDAAPPPADRGSVLAVAGIAAPDRFRRALEANGWKVARFLTFRDHHRYTRSDLDTIAAEARNAQASAVLTTGKDAVRLLPLRPFPIPVAVVPLEVSVEPAAEFGAWLDARCREARR
jgi:tetraacyldisaccharide 4'-kinase